MFHDIVDNHLKTFGQQEIQSYNKYIFRDIFIFILILFYIFNNTYCSDGIIIVLILLTTFKKRQLDYLITNYEITVFKT